MITRTLGLGFLQDDPDHRDRQLTDRDFGAAVDVGVPYAAACTELLPRVLDQGTDESCVAQAVAALIWAAHRRAGVPDVLGELASRKALWWLARAERGLSHYNTGTQPRTLIRCANTFGLCRERWHDHRLPLDRRPTAQAAHLSADQRNRGDGRVEYRAVLGEGVELLDAVRRAIAAGLPVGLGFAVSHAFARHDFVTSVPLDPPRNGDIAGLHYMAVHAYQGDEFLLRNSYGAEWNRGGDVWFSRAYVEQGLSGWTVVRAPAFSDEVRT